MTVTPQTRWQELTTLLDRIDWRGLRSLSPDEVRQVCRLYRQVTIDLSRARTDGADPILVQYLNLLAARAHGQVYAARPVNIRGFFSFIAGGFAALIRRRHVAVFGSVAVFLLSTLASFLAVVREPQLAYSLFSENVIEHENIRLERQQGEYKGNFTFSLSQSPLVAVQIILNNIRVSCLVFALGALFALPAVLLLIYNGRMLGTLAGLMWNAHYLGDFNALILTHGVLELSAICIAGGGGMLVGWALISPGERTRTEAMRIAAREGFGLLAGACLMLIVAGIIEAYVTPHTPQPVRWATAITTGMLLAFYIWRAGRTKSAEASVAA